MNGVNMRFVILAVIVLSLDRNVSAEQMPSTPRLTIKYADKKIQFTGLDVNGKPTFSKYDGTVVISTATVGEVKVVNDSPSVSIDNDIAVFELSETSAIPKHPKCRFVEIRFDEHAIFEAKPFRVGDLWELLFSKNGELVDLRPVNTKLNEK